MKRMLNPLIEKIGCKVAGVDVYPDVFERLAFRPGWAPVIRTLFAHKVTPDVRDSKVLFVHVPKNGGTSVKQSLYVSDPGHATVRFYEMIAPELLDNHVTFAVLREPIDRFLSAFDFLMAKGGANVAIQARPFRRLRHIKDLDQLLDYLETLDGDWLRVDTFLRPQWWYLVDHADRVRIDNLFVLGDDNARINAFLERFGQPPVPHLNATDRKSWKLSPDQERRVRRLYKRDFDLFALGSKAAPGRAAANALAAST